MASLSRELEDILKCALCLETVGHEPKTLRMCGHTFCHNCFMLNFIRKDVVSCPICRIESFVGMLQPRIGDRGAGGNTQIVASAVEFLEKYRNQLDNAKCSACGCLKEAYVCLDCAEKNEEKAKDAAKPKYEYEFDTTSTVYETVQNRIKSEKAKFEKIKPQSQQGDEKKNDEKHDDDECNVM